MGEIAPLILDDKYQLEMISNKVSTIFGMTVICFFKAP